MNNYLAASHDIERPGRLVRPGGDRPTSSTSEDIHNAQMKLNTQWGELIQALRAAADHYRDAGRAVAAAIRSVPAPVVI